MAGHALNEIASTTAKILAEEFERCASERDQQAMETLKKIANGTCRWWDMYVAEQASAVTWKSAAAMARDLAEHATKGSGQ